MSMGKNMILNMNTNEYIEKELKYLKKLQKILSSDITAVSPGEKIYIKKLGKYYRLYSRIKSESGKYHDNYISLKSKRAKDYINSIYAQRTIPLLRAEIKALEDFQQHYHPEKKFGTLDKFPAEMRLMLNHPVKSSQEEAEEWANTSFYSNPYPVEGFEYVGKNGEHFRSKAEYIIANLLYELGIPFRYECEYAANGKTTYPDFTIMHPNTGELFYIEYFGLMDDPDYSQSALKKISLYQQCPDTGQFIFFFESANSPMNIKGIRNTIMNVLGGL